MFSSLYSGFEHKTINMTGERLSEIPSEIHGKEVGVSKRKTYTLMESVDE